MAKDADAVQPKAILGDTTSVSCDTTTVPKVAGSSSTPVPKTGDSETAPKPGLSRTTVSKVLKHFAIGSLISASDIECPWNACTVSRVAKVLVVFLWIIFLLISNSNSSS